MASPYDEAMLSGDDDEAYESPDECDAVDRLLTGGESEGVRDGALDEFADEAG